MNFKKVLSAVAAASMLVGCGSGNGGSKGVELKDGDTIKIGFVGPTSGETSTYGIPVARSIELAIADYNASKDAKYKVELLKEDSAGDAQQATSAYKKLVGEGIVGIVGPVITAEGLALGEASKNDGTPIVSSSTSGDSVTLNNDGSTKANYFRTCSNDSMGGKTIASAIGKGTIKASKVAILTNSDSDYSGGCTDSFVKQAKEDGTQIVLEKKYPQTQKDFKTYIQQVMSSGADAVFIPDYYETIATMVKQFKDAGFKGTFLGTDGWDGVLSVKDVDKSIFNGAYYTNTFDDRVEAVQKYVEAYKAKYNAETNMFGTMAYDATWVLIKAVEAAGTTDPEKVCAALEKTDYTGITGTFKFDSQHNPTKELVVKTIKDGAYTYLD
ncbi:ABC transporter substrate-binding protein [Candidatus Stoquefichus sp. SB1]|uniref:ABC transporter substrate-binding protein n=1 Tax=Candidatus Stoquefichus sp. SB1 TaxID=1658109 RepID=UPI00067EF617|nr:ABC transporter substrate-binding protein [Candidatus Stoquefichus sp. SB1]